MPVWLDKRYVNLISPKLELFKWKKPTLANFRCPYCGDSQKNKRKARGFLYTKGQDMFYKCHNCPESTNLSNFIKFIDPGLHLEYLRESFAEKGKEFRDYSAPAQVVEEKPKVREYVEGELKCGTFISKLPETHYAWVYLKQRGIFSDFLLANDLMFTENMRDFIRENIDPNLENVPTDPHIVILIRNEKDKIVGCNGRSLKPENPFSKYIKAKVNEDVKLVYGLERLSTSEKIYVFEGEFNSMFVDNGIAVGGVNNMLGIETFLGVNKESVVLVIDNDKRNPEVVRSIEKAVDAGYEVVIFPGNIECGDVNDLVLEHKLDTDGLQKFLDENTYSGLRAKLKLSEWKKCDATTSKFKNRYNKSTI
jgi:hypothetical protein